MNIKKFVKKVIKFYAALSVPLSLSFMHVTGNLYVFLVEFVPGTTEEKVHKHLREARLALKLRLFQLHWEGMELYLVVSQHKDFDNRLLGIITSPSYADFTKDMALPYPVGFDAIRRPVILDIAEYKHWFMGGANNSGKTVAIESLIASIALSRSPTEVNLIVFDGLANLTQFNGLPHLSCDILQDTNTGAKVIAALKKEMERRIAIKQSDDEEFDKQPYIVCILDELVSFFRGIGVSKTPDWLPGTVSHLIRIGRHAKIIMVLAAQNPLADEIKCDISSISSRIAFTCAKPNNSVTILGVGGAEKLSGNGEMYFASSKHEGLRFMKGSYISREETKKVCEHVISKYQNTAWDNSRKFQLDTEWLHAVSIEDDVEISTGQVISRDTEDSIFATIIIWALGRETVSGNAIHKRFNIGERKASKLLERLEKMGIADKANVKVGRKVLPTCLEELAVEVVSFLHHHNYTNENIIDAFGKTDCSPVFDESRYSDALSVFKDSDVVASEYTGGDIYARCPNCRLVGIKEEIKNK